MAVGEQLGTISDQQLHQHGHRSGHNPCTVIIRQDGQVLHATVATAAASYHLLLQHAAPKFHRIHLSACCSQWHVRFTLVPTRPM